MNASEYAKQRMQLADKYKPSNQSLQTAQTVHQYIKMTQFPQACPRANYRGRGGHRGPLRGGRSSYRGGMGGTCCRRDYRHSTETTLGTVAHGPTEQEKNARPQTKNATTVGDLDISQKYVDKDQTIKIVKRLQSNTLTWRNNPQTTFRVSTLSLMSKQKPQSSVSRLQLESTTFKTKTQNISDPNG